MGANMSTNRMKRCGGGLQGDHCPIWRKRGLHEACKVYVEGRFEELKRIVGTLWNSFG